MKKTLIENDLIYLHILNTLKLLEVGLYPDVSDLTFINMKIEKFHAKEAVYRKYFSLFDEEPNCAGYDN